MAELHQHQSPVGNVFGAGHGASQRGLINGWRKWVRNFLQFIICPPWSKRKMLQKLGAETLYLQEFLRSNTAEHWEQTISESITLVFLIKLTGATI